MSERIRILLADDSAVARRLLTETLSNHDSIEVVASAKNGQEALSLISTLKPDVVVLDVEMPVMDGLEALQQLRAVDRWIPVIIFSSLTVSGARATLEALSLGANDYVAKPSGAGHVSQAITYINRELTPRIQHWGARIRTMRESRFRIPSLEPVTVPSSPDKRGRTDVVAIGASTGGPNALATILAALTPRLRVPILIAQHMPSLFTRLLAERLDRTCPLSVREATDGAIVNEGDVWIAPGDFHMTVRSENGITRIVLDQASAENSCRPSVDVLFRSVAQVYADRALAIVLTGMGKDGTAGCRVLKQRGAYVVVQDEQSSTVWGMPRAVAEAGLADRVRPLSDMATEINVTVGLSSRTDSGQRTGIGVLQ